MHDHAFPRVSGLGRVLINRPPNADLDAPPTSVIGGKADMARTVVMSANDPNRTCAIFESPTVSERRQSIAVGLGPSFFFAKPFDVDFGLLRRSKTARHVLLAGLNTRAVVLDPVAAEAAEGRRTKHA
jgi:hypothetical protein